MKFSQREARRLQKRVDELEKQLNDQRYAWAREWPGGTHLGTIDCTSKIYDTQVLVARKLGHAVVLTYHQADKLEMYALPLPVKP